MARKKKTDPVADLPQGDLPADRQEGAAKHKRKASAKPKPVSRVSRVRATGRGGRGR